MAERFDVAKPGVVALLLVSIFCTAAQTQTAAGAYTNACRVYIIDATAARKASGGECDCGANIKSE